MSSGVRWAVIDSNVYIDHWERGLHQPVLDQVRQAYIVRHLAVVLSELRRGARTQAARRLVETLNHVAHDVWTPSEGDWWEAAKLVRDIGDAHSWDPVRRRAFQNDALIALTARQHGATLVTGNRQDFALLARRTGVRLLLV